MSVKELRSQTAERMRSRADDFLPFLTNPNSGDMYTTGTSHVLLSVARDVEEKKKLVTSLHISDGFVLLLISRRV